MTRVRIMCHYLASKHLFSIPPNPPLAIRFESIPGLPKTHTSATTQFAAHMSCFSVLGSVAAFTKNVSSSSSSQRWGKDTCVVDHVCDIPSSMVVFIIAVLPHLTKLLLPAFNPQKTWEHLLATKPDLQQQIKT